MMFYNLLLTIPFTTGLIFSVVGFIMLKFPPKNINVIYGYRTNASMKNQKRWDFAQIYASKTLIKTGLLLSLCGLIGLVYQPNETNATIIGMALLLFSILLIFTKVEKKLKSEFSENE